ncbi:MAG: ribbon-helix-helix domain-containing protein [Alphaproteobacteria bacterium]|nr:ribbon-helix-helix domain-containing protein [Alphaproteobacteria bacterium]
MTLRRHSVRIAGHATSISIEDAFWQEIRRAAKEDGISTARLIEAVDRARTGDDGGGGGDGAPGLKGAPNLSSALRLYVLERLRA